MWVQKLLTFFWQKILAHLILGTLEDNESLTNDFVNVKMLWTTGPCLAKGENANHTKTVPVEQVRWAFDNP